MSKITATLEKLGTCHICRREVLDNGQCLYCTTGQALGLRALVPDNALMAPADEEVITLVEMARLERFQLEAPRTRVGRDPQNQIVLGDDVYASRHHAYITY